MTIRTVAADRSVPRTTLVQHVVLALVAYVPLLLTAAGRVAADTKTYLYLDPGRLLARAPSLWDPNVGLGTVTHQTIGYLWPMGPWFWTFEQLGVPDWVAQRLWVGTLLFAAGAGVLYLLRTLGVARANAVGAVAAALVYALSPYVLHYAARISVLLLPWAALPWLVALVQRAVRTQSWRHPAAFALLVATAGGVNATALVLAGLGPLLWVPFAVWVHGEASWREGLAATLRVGILTVLCSLWWITGLAIQGSYGVDILRYTETVETVSRTALASEVLRGLGYWFFYGGDKLGPWIEPGRSYTQQLWLIGVGFAVPILALAAAVAIRWRYRAYAVAMVLLGTAVAVGAYPYDAPSPIGGLFKAFARTSTAGLALRSTPRAVPLVVLGLALLLAAALAALARRAPERARWGALAVALVAAAGIPPLWTGEFIGENLQRPEDIPDYWEEAAAWLDERGHDTRVLEIPGSDFASYRWGNTVDPITPGLMDRPFVARELIPYGSEASADLLAALDRRLQEGVLDPAVLAPVARLLGVGDVLLRSDLQYERYRTPRPLPLWSLLQPEPPGLGEPVEFGPATPNVAIPELPIRDEILLGTPADTPDPAPVTVFPVEHPLPIVRPRGATAPVVLEGDGEGTVEAAGAGLLDGDGVLLYAAALADRPDVLADALDAEASLVVSDTNRRRARRWSTVRENTGYTEQAGETPLREDPSDNRLPLFPESDDDAFTTVELRGVARAQATRYGNPVSYTPEDRPVNAFDSDVRTAWRVGAFDGVGGERLELETLEPVTTDHLTLVQPVTGPRNRFITRVTVELDGRRVGTFDLTEASRTEKGQRLDLGEREFSVLTLEVAADNIGKRALYDGLSGVGFAEVRVAGVTAEEIVRLPTALLDATGPSLDNPLTFLLARQRANPQELVRSDEEPSLVRSFRVPAARQFAVDGQARLSAHVSDEVVDRLLGGSGPTTTSSRRLAGDLTSRAAAAIDRDQSTAWVPGFGEQVGDWIEIDISRLGSIDRLDLVVLADGHHSVPTRLSLSVDGATPRLVDVPAVDDGGERGTTAGAPVTFEPLSGSRLRVTIDDVRVTPTIDWFSGEAVTMPVGIAELGIPALPEPTYEGLSDACRDDLIRVDGRSVPVRVMGEAAAAERREALRLAPCDDDDGGALSLDDGDHLLRTTPGTESGIDVDRLVLASAAGGRPAAPTDAAPRGPTAAPPTVTVADSGRTSFDLVIEGAREPFWLVLGQSHSAGWSATADGAGSLGAPVLVDGYANGWLVTPDDGGTIAVSLRWTPQRFVWLGLWLSLAAAVACLAIAVVGWRRHHAVAAPPPEPVIRTRWPADGPAASWRATAVCALLVGGAAALITHPLVGLGVVAASVAAMRLALGRLVAIGPVVLLGLAALFTIGRQWRNAYPPDFGWADFFSPAHHLAWGALWLLVVTVVADRLRRRPPP